MSAALAASTLEPTPAALPHIPRTTHPIPLRERAFALHCQGLRSPAIARDLGVPERTVRAWIAAALDELKDDQQFSRREQLLIAVERQHALTAAAWQQFEAETAARAALLDAALAACLPAAATLSAARPPHAPNLPATTPAPRYLSLILQASKETNRLLGLYTLARLDLLVPADLTEPASLPDATGHDHAAESATATAETEYAAASAPLDHQFPAESATAADITDSAADPATGPATIELAASSATALATPDSAAMSPRPDHQVPAKSATASTSAPQATTRQPVLSHGWIATAPPSIHREDHPHVAGRSAQRVHAPGSE